MRAQYRIGGQGARAQSGRAALLDPKGFPAQNARVRLATFNIKHALLLLGPGVLAARSARAIDTGASDHPLVVVEL